MDKYSVLMSVYIKERPEWMRAAVDSMLNQTVKPDEITIVKDGPLTDELNQLIQYYCDNYDCFNIVGYPENKGLGYALNYGVTKCRNELIARMDTDDISLADRCEKQLKIFTENKDIDICGGDISEFIGEPENIVAYRRVPVSDSEIREYMKKRCAFNHGAVMFKKQAVLDSGNYQDFYWNEDYYLWIRMMLNGAKFANTGDVLVNFRTGADMYSRRGGKKYFASELSLQKYMLENKIINYPTYLMNVLKRLIVQILLPNSIRGWVFRTFARSN